MPLAVWVGESSSNTEPGDVMGGGDNVVLGKVLASPERNAATSPTASELLKVSCVVGFRFERTFLLSSKLNCNLCAAATA